MKSYWKGSRERKGNTVRYASVALFEDLFSVYTDPSNWTNFKVSIQLCNSLSRSLMKDWGSEGTFYTLGRLLKGCLNAIFSSCNPLFNVKISSPTKHAEAGKSENQKKGSQIKTLQWWRTVQCTEIVLPTGLSFTKNIFTRKIVSVCVGLNQTPAMWIHTVNRHLHRQF